MVSLNKKSRMLFGSAVVLLLLLYFFPIWRIGLSAPQYPEGMGLYIWINKISGENKHDLDNINRLNHYIGMKEILPNEIPELKILPFLIGALILIGLIGIFTNKRIFFFMWFTIFLITTVIGMVDFYKWEYDYGHNLNPKAPIKVPGMTYQPPLIGTKKLLNITAASYPASGGWFAILSLSIGLIILLIEKNINPWRRMISRQNTGLSGFILSGFFLILIPSCSAEPSPIDYGHDMCALCQMIISDQRFGAELVTAKGKIYKYDSVECLVADYLTRNSTEDKLHSLWVTDFNSNSNLIRANSAIYLHSTELRSPMGMGLSASSDEQQVSLLKSKFGGNLLQWDQVVKLIEETERFKIE